MAQTSIGDDTKAPQDDGVFNNVLNTLWDAVEYVGNTEVAKFTWWLLDWSLAWNFVSDTYNAAKNFVSNADDFKYLDDSKGILNGVTKYNFNDKDKQTADRINKLWFTDTATWLIWAGWEALKWNKYTWVVFNKLWVSDNEYNLNSNLKIDKESFDKQTTELETQLQNLQWKKFNLWIEPYSNFLQFQSNIDSMYKQSRWVWEIQDKEDYNNFLAKEFSKLDKALQNNIIREQNNYLKDTSSIDEEIKIKQWELSTYLNNNINSLDGVNWEALYNKIKDSNIKSAKDNDLLAIKWDLFNSAKEEVESRINPISLSKWSTNKYFDDVKDSIIEDISTEKEYYLTLLWDKKLNNNEEFASKYKQVADLSLKFKTDFLNKYSETINNPEYKWQTDSDIRKAIVKDLWNWLSEQDKNLYKEKEKIVTTVSALQEFRVAWDRFKNLNPWSAINLVQWFTSKIQWVMDQAYDFESDDIPHFLKQDTRNIIYAWEWYGKAIWSAIAYNPDTILSIIGWTLWLWTMAKTVSKTLEWLSMIAQSNKVLNIPISFAKTNWAMKFVWRWVEHLVESQLYWSVADAVIDNASEQAYTFSNEWLNVISNILFDTTPFIIKESNSWLKQSTTMNNLMYKYFTDPEDKKAIEWFTQWLNEKLISNEKNKQDFKPLTNWDSRLILQNVKEWLFPNLFNPVEYKNMMEKPWELYNFLTTHIQQMEETKQKEILTAKWLWLKLETNLEIVWLSKENRNSLEDAFAKKIWNNPLEAQFNTSRMNELIKDNLESLKPWKGWVTNWNIYQVKKEFIKDPWYKELYKKAEDTLDELNKTKNAEEFQKHLDNYDNIANTIKEKYTNLEKRKFIRIQNPIWWDDIRIDKTKIDEWFWEWTTLESLARDWYVTIEKNWSFKGKQTRLRTNNEISIEENIDNYFKSNSKDINKKTNELGIEWVNSNTIHQITKSLLMWNKNNQLSAILNNNFKNFIVTADSVKLADKDLEKLTELMLIINSNLKKILWEENMWDFIFINNSFKTDKDTWKASHKKIIERFKSENNYLNLWYWFWRNNKNDDFKFSVYLMPSWKLLENKNILERFSWTKEVIKEWEKVTKSWFAILLNQWSKIIDSLLVYSSTKEWKLDFKKGYTTLINSFTKSFDEWWKIDLETIKTNLIDIYKKYNWIKWQDLNEETLNKINFFANNIELLVWKEHKTDIAKTTAELQISAISDFYVTHYDVITKALRTIKNEWVASKKDWDIVINEINDFLKWIVSDSSKRKRFFEEKIKDSIDVSKEIETKILDQVEKLEEEIKNYELKVWTDEDKNGNITKQLEKAKDLVKIVKSKDYLNKSIIKFASSVLVNWYDNYIKNFDIFKEQTQSSLNIKYWDLIKEYKVKVESIANLTDTQKENIKDFLNIYSNWTFKAKEMDEFLSKFEGKQKEMYEILLEIWKFHSDNPLYIKSTWVFDDLEESLLSWRYNHEWASKNNVIWNPLFAFLQWTKSNENLEYNKLLISHFLWKKITWKKDILFTEINKYINNKTKTVDEIRRDLAYNVEWLELKEDWSAYKRWGHNFKRVTDKLNLWIKLEWNPNREIIETWRDLWNKADNIMKSFFSWNTTDIKLFDNNLDEEFIQQLELIKGTMLRLQDIVWTWVLVKWNDVAWEIDMITRNQDWTLNVYEFLTHKNTSNSDTTYKRLKEYWTILKDNWYEIKNLWIIDAKLEYKTWDKLASWFSILNSSRLYNQSTWESRQETKWMKNLNNVFEKYIAEWSMSIEDKDLLLEMFSIVDDNILEKLKYHKQYWNNPWFYIWESIWLSSWVKDPAQIFIHEFWHFANDLLLNNSENKYVEKFLKDNVDDIREKYKWYWYDDWSIDYITKDSKEFFAQEFMHYFIQKSFNKKESLWLDTILKKVWEKFTSRIKSIYNSILWLEDNQKVSSIKWYNKIEEMYDRVLKEYWSFSKEASNSFDDQFKYLNIKLIEKRSDWTWKVSINWSNIFNIGKNWIWTQNKQLIDFDSNIFINDVFDSEWNLKESQLWLIKTWIIKANWFKELWLKTRNEFFQEQYLKTKDKDVIEPTNDLLTDREANYTVNELYDNSENFRSFIDWLNDFKWIKEWDEYLNNVIDKVEEDKKYILKTFKKIFNDVRISTNKSDNITNELLDKLCNDDKFYKKLKDLKLYSIQKEWEWSCAFNYRVFKDSNWKDQIETVLSTKKIIPLQLQNMISWVTDTRLKLLNWLNTWNIWLLYNSIFDDKITSNALDSWDIIRLAWWEPMLATSTILKKQIHEIFWEQYRWFSLMLWLWDKDSNFHLYKMEDRFYNIFWRFKHDGKIDLETYNRINAMLYHIDYAYANWYLNGEKALTEGWKVIDKKDLLNKLYESFNTSEVKDIDYYTNEFQKITKDTLLSTDIIKKREASNASVKNTFWNVKKEVDLLVIEELEWFKSKDYREIFWLDKDYSFDIPKEPNKDNPKYDKLYKKYLLDKENYDKFTNYITSIIDDRSLMKNKDWLSENIYYLIYSDFNKEEKNYKEVIDKICQWIRNWYLNDNQDWTSFVSNYLWKLRWALNWLDRNHINSNSYRVFKDHFYWEINQIRFMWKSAFSLSDIKEWWKSLDNAVCVWMSSVKLNKDNFIKNSTKTEITIDWRRYVAYRIKWADTSFFKDATTDIIKHWDDTTVWDSIKNILDLIAQWLILEKQRLAIKKSFKKLLGWLLSTDIDINSFSSIEQFLTNAISMWNIWYWNSNVINNRLKEFLTECDEIINKVKWKWWSYFIRESNDSINENEIILHENSSLVKQLREEFAHKIYFDRIKKKLWLNFTFEIKEKDDKHIENINSIIKKRKLNYETLLDEKYNKKNQTVDSKTGEKNFEDYLINDFDKINFPNDFNKKYKNLQEMIDDNLYAVSYRFPVPSKYNLWTYKILLSKNYSEKSINELWEEININPYEFMWDNQVVLHPHVTYNKVEWDNDWDHLFFVSVNDGYWEIIADSINRDKFDMFYKNNKDLIKPNLSITNKISHLYNSNELHNEFVIVSQVDKSNVWKSSKYMDLVTWRLLNLEAKKYVWTVTSTIRTVKLLDKTISWDIKKYLKMSSKINKYPLWWVIQWVPFYYKGKKYIYKADSSIGTDDIIHSFYDLDWDEVIWKFSVNGNELTENIWKWKYENVLNSNWKPVILNGTKLNYITKIVGEEDIKNVILDPFKDINSDILEQINMNNHRKIWNELKDLFDKKERKFAEAAASILQIVLDFANSWKTEFDKEWFVELLSKVPIFKDYTKEELAMVMIRLITPISTWYKKNSFDPFNIKKVNWILMDQDNWEKLTYKNKKVITENLYWIIWTKRELLFEIYNWIVDWVSADWKEKTFMWNLIWKLLGSTDTLYLIDKIKWEFWYKPSKNVEENIDDQNSKIIFEESKSDWYRERTIENAKADATIAIATDFTTRWEQLTKNAVNSNNKKYIPLDWNSLIINEQRINRIVDDLNSVSAKTLNIAWNWIYTMEWKYTQEQVDNFTYELLKWVLSSDRLKNKIVSIRSWWQTWFDEAWIKAWVKLWIPTKILAPKWFKFRTLQWDISDELKFKERFWKEYKVEQSYNVNREWTMFFQYWKDKRKEVKALNTFDAIVNWERTSTTYNRTWAGNTHKWDIIRWWNTNEVWKWKYVDVIVTEEPKKIELYNMSEEELEQWSKNEWRSLDSTKNKWSKLFNEPTWNIRYKLVDDSTSIKKIDTLSVLQELEKIGTLELKNKAQIETYWEMLLNDEDNLLSWSYRKTKYRKVKKDKWYETIEVKEPEENKELVLWYLEPSDPDIIRIKNWFREYLKWTNLIWKDYNYSDYLDKIDNYLDKSVNKQVRYDWLDNMASDVKENKIDVKDRYNLALYSTLSWNVNIFNFLMWKEIKDFLTFSDRVIDLKFKSLLWNEELWVVEKTKEPSLKENYNDILKTLSDKVWLSDNIDLRPWYKSKINYDNASEELIAKQTWATNVLDVNDIYIWNELVDIDDKWLKLLSWEVLWTINRSRNYLQTRIVSFFEMYDPWLLTVYNNLTDLLWHSYWKDKQIMDLMNVYKNEFTESYFKKDSLVNIIKSSWDKDYINNINNILWLLIKQDWNNYVLNNIDDVLNKIWDIYKWTSSAVLKDNLIFKDKLWKFSTDFWEQILKTINNIQDKWYNLLNIYWKDTSSMIKDIINCHSWDYNLTLRIRWFKKREDYEYFLNKTSSARWEKPMQWTIKTMCDELFWWKQEWYDKIYWFLQWLHYSWNYWKLSLLTWNWIWSWLAQMLPNYVELKSYLRWNIEDIKEWYSIMKEYWLLDSEATIYFWSWIWLDLQSKWIDGSIDAAFKYITNRDLKWSKAASFLHSVLTSPLWWTDFPIENMRKCVAISNTMKSMWLNRRTLNNYINKYWKDFEWIFRWEVRKQYAESWWWVNSNSSIYKWTLFKYWHNYADFIWVRFLTQSLWYLMWWSFHKTWVNLEKRMNILNGFYDLSKWNIEWFKSHMYDWLVYQSMVLKQTAIALWLYLKMEKYERDPNDMVSFDDFSKTFMNQVISFWILVDKYIWNWETAWNNWWDFIDQVWYTTTSIARNAIRMIWQVKIITTMYRHFVLSQEMWEANIVKSLQFALREHSSSFLQFNNMSEFNNIYDKSSWDTVVWLLWNWAKTEEDKMFQNLSDWSFYARYKEEWFISSLMNNFKSLIWINTPTWINNLVAEKISKIISDDKKISQLINWWQFWTWVNDYNLETLYWRSWEAMTPEQTELAISLYKKLNDYRFDYLNASWKKDTKFNDTTIKMLNQQIDESLKKEWINIETLIEKSKYNAEFIKQLAVLSSKYAISWPLALSLIIERDYKLQEKKLRETKWLYTWEQSEHWIKYTSLSVEDSNILKRDLLLKYQQYFNLDRNLWMAIIDQHVRTFNKDKLEWIKKVIDEKWYMINEWIDFLQKSFMIWQVAKTWDTSVSKLHSRYVSASKWLQANETTVHLVNTFLNSLFSNSSLSYKEKLSNAAWFLSWINKTTYWILSENEEFNKLTEDSRKLLMNWTFKINKEALDFDSNSLVNNLKSSQYWFSKWSFGGSLRMLPIKHKSNSFEWPRPWFSKQFAPLKQMMRPEYIDSNPDNFIKWYTKKNYWWSIIPTYDNTKTPIFRQYKDLLLEQLYYWYKSKWVSNYQPIDKKKEFKKEIVIKKSRPVKEKKEFIKPKVFKPYKKNVFSNWSLSSYDWT